MKNVNDKTLCVIILLFAITLFVVRANAQQFVYKGVYNVQTIIVNYCDDCFLELPPDYLNSDIVMSVQTDETKNFIKALQTSSRAIGWELTIGKDGKFKAQPVQNADNMVYISCLDNQPKNVPRYLYSASVNSDKLQCAQRDSLQIEQRKKFVHDSLRSDSLSKIKLDFANYQLRYFAYSKSFTDKLGFDWEFILANGNLHNKIKFFDDWRFVAQQTNDTSFTSRSVEFSVDSSLSLDWGSEEQTLKQTFVNNGVTTQDYEWRKYGLLINVKRDGKRVIMNYVFRDKDNSISVLQGSVIGTDGDTLRLIGEYTLNRNVEMGVPFISSVPILGEIFKSRQNIVDNRAFELYLLPKKAVKDDRQSK